MVSTIEHLCITIFNDFRGTDSDYADGRQDRNMLTSNIVALILIHVPVCGQLNTLKELL